MVVDPVLAENDEVVAAAPVEAEAAEEEEESGHDEDVQEELRPTQPLALNDPGRMDLTQEEREWALSIKEAIEEDGTGSLEPMCDYWYAQISLVDKGNIPAALDRVHHMQLFRQEYDIQDTVAQGTQVIKKYMEYFPGFYLSLSYNSSGGNYTVVFDLTKFHTSVLRNNLNAHRIWFQAIYYINHAICPDFEAIRQGMVMLCECSDFQWKKNFGLEVLRPYWADIAAVYPLNHHRIKAFHTGVFFNTIISMGKKFMPVEARDILEVGCMSEMGRLSKVYLTPSLEAANERFLDRFISSLQLRYKNETSFSIS